MLIGLEILVITVQRGYYVAALLAIPIVLMGRLLSLTLPVLSMRLFRVANTPISILTWGGLRGGLPIAMALSLPPSNSREVIVISTYGVVAFAMLVQATTMPWLLKRVLKANEA